MENNWKYKERPKTILGKMVEEEIENRTATGKILADKFPELKGLTFEELLMKCPLELDFITACEMHAALNPTPTPLKEE